MEHLFPYPKMGTSFLEVLHDPLTRKLLGFDAVYAEKTPFISGVTSRLKFLLNDDTTHLPFLKIGYTALEAFLQANCTGPPLDFNPEESIFPETYWNDGLKPLKDELFQYLAVDGSGPYSLTPHIELFWLAKVVISNNTLAEAGFNGRRARFRVNFWHQKLLAEEAPSLCSALYADAEVLEHQLSSRLAYGGAAAEEHFVEFLVERAVVRTHYGDDHLARIDLANAATTRQFQFALTGALGRRTKFQDRDLSQLVVLAKSRDHEPEPYSSRKSSRAEPSDSRKASAVDTSSPARHPPLKSPTLPTSPPLPSVPHRSATPTRTIDSHEHRSPLVSPPTQPENVLLNDDTLLERIYFKQTLAPVSSDNMTHVVSSESALPPQLAALDPANQPLLFPMDSIILLTTASSISNTSPSDGLVREETLPYATRVLDGGSSNWQVYTQALLVRSRIEGYRSRTTERGLLQLQALVDQVIAETSETQLPTSQTTSSASDPNTNPPASNTFLPKASASESASVAERLRYVYQLSPPLRWELEAELAARWTHMGGLKTALEIYERLQMHAEVALCLAATDREGDAIKLLKSILFEEVTTDATTTAEPGQENGGTTDETKSLKLRSSPPPTDAPRLLCILGDITSHPSYYDLSWTASGNRYARAQRSLGRHFTKKRDFPAAAQAFTLALGVSKVDRASWFSLGCVQLELEDWQGAVESFTRCVQVEDSDGESWSNMAVALLKLPPPQQPSSATEDQQQEEGQASSTTTVEAHDHEELLDPLTMTQQQRQEHRQQQSPYAHVFSALRALRRAATLKRDDARIWDNYLTVAASIPPSAGTPWSEIIQAMGRVVELRGKREGEGCVDLAIFKVLVEYITTGYDYPTSDGGGGGGGGGGSDDKENSINTLEKATGATEGGEHAAQGEKVAVQPLQTGAPEQPSTSAITSTSTGAGATEATTPRLPHLPASLLHLIDTLITPLATSSPELYTLLSRVSTWRARPSLALAQAEKAWRLHLTRVSAAEEFDNVALPDWESVVDKTVWLIRVYADLGPRERERTGGAVEDKWRFKARSAARRVLGRAKASWGGSEPFERLRGEVEGLKE